MNAPMMPAPVRCPQCWSWHCPQLVCRFSGLTHEEAAKHERLCPAANDTVCVDDRCNNGGECARVVWP